MTSQQGIAGAIFRRAWRFARWPLGVLLVLAITLFGINVVDADLSPQTQEMLRAPDNPYSDEENIYVLLAGIDAPAGESMVERGRSNIWNFAAALEQLPPGASLPEAVGTTPSELAWQPKAAEVDWKALQDSVWDWSRDNVLAIAASAAENRELLKRYESLHDATGYHETLAPSEQGPIYIGQSSLRRLFLSDIARRIRAGGPEQADALRALGEDLDLWHRVLQGEGTLVSKMIAVSYLHTNLLLLSDIVADASVPLPVVQAGAAHWLQPMPLDNWKIGRVFASELRFQYGLLHPLAEHPQYMLHLPDDSPTLWQRFSSRVAGQFYLPNATMNLQAARMRELWNIVDAGPDGLAQRMEAFNQRERETGLALPSVLRNPIGRILTIIGLGAYGEYGLRAYDVGAMQRATALAWRIRAEGIEPDAIPGFLAAHPESGSDFEDVRFRWDAATMLLQVPQQAKKRKDWRYSVRVVSPLHSVH